MASTEPSSPAISESCSHDTFSGEMSISLTSTDEGINIIPAAEELAKFFPQLDEDLNSVSIYAPMNTDTLNVDLLDAVFASGSGNTDRSNCLTPVSIGMDISMVANKGSITLSMDGLDDDDEMTLSAATTPSLPADEYKLETCYCCPAHADLPPAPPEVEDDLSPAEVIVTESTVATTLPTPSKLPQHAEETFAPVRSDSLRRNVRKTTDPLSPHIQKQVSLFEGDKELFFTISSSINFPTQSLQLDARLRKFENLTQSTSNSNFPFESNTLKKSNLPSAKPDDMDFTKSCINLKSSSIISGASSEVCSAGGSPQHKATVTAEAAALLSEQPALDSSNNLAAVATTATSSAQNSGALLVKTKFIEPPKRITRSFYGKTQSMDSEILLHDFLTVPQMTSGMMQQQQTSISGSNSPCTSPSTKQMSRFVATKVMDDMEIDRK